MAPALSKDAKVAAGFAVAVAVLMIAQQLAGKALRDAFFLSHFKADALPTVMMVSSVLSVGAVLGASQLFRRMPPGRLVPIVFWVSAAWFVAEWALSSRVPRIAAVSLYIHTTSFGAVVVSGFWSVVNERFDPHTAKLVIGRIAGGATAGGVLGGLAAWQGASQLSIGGMVLVLAAVSTLSGLGVWKLGSGAQHETAPSQGKPPSLLAIMDETPYLWHLALLVATSAFGAAAFDYVFKARAAAAYDSSQELVSFFALFYLGLGIVTFFVQNLFAARVLRWLGLSVTVATMPATVIAFGLGALAFGGLWSAVLLRGSAAVVESSLYRSGYELLYTPLTPAKKRATKTLIDVGSDKLGAAAGSGVALVVVGLFPASSEAVLLGVAVLCGISALVVTRYLHRGYVSSLAESLKTGAVDASAVTLVDASTQRTFHETLSGFDRDLVLKNLKAESQGLAVSIVRPKTTAMAAERAPVITFDAELPTAEIDQTLRAIAALRSGHGPRVRAVLQQMHPLPRELVVHTFALLKQDELRSEVMLALRHVLPVHHGLVADVLLSEQSAPEIRRQLPALLEYLPTQGSADTLLQALKTESFELRFRAALALRSIVTRNERVKVDEAAVQDAVARVLFEMRLAYPVHALADEARLGPRVVFAFVLLSTILPAEPLQLALSALAQTTPARRGTGREYLENVLPKALSDDLMGLVEDPALAQRASQPEATVFHEIASAAEEKWIDLEGLSARFAEA